MREKPKKEPKEKYDSHLPRTRCTLAERNAINDNAKIAGLSLSAYMREIGVNGKITIKESKTDVQLMRQLSSIGNNLNQYVKRVHIRGLNRQEHDLLFGCINKLDVVLTRLLNDTEN